MKSFPVLRQAVEPATKDTATSRAWFLSLSLSLPPPVFFRICARRELTQAQDLHTGGWQAGTHNFATPWPLPVKRIISTAPVSSAPRVLSAVRVLVQQRGFQIDPGFFQPGMELHVSSSNGSCSMVAPCPTGCRSSERQENLASVW